MSEPSAFFEQDGSRFIPSVLTRGPWRPEHQHGGPPSALMARAIEAEADSLHLARFTVDFVQPVPIAPLTLRVEQVREGRRARNYVVELSGDDDLVVARSTALVLRPAPAASDVAITRERLDPPPAQSEPFARRAGTGGLGESRAVDAPARAARGWRGAVALPTHSSHGGLGQRRGRRARSRELRALHQRGSERLAPPPPRRRMDGPGSGDDHRAPRRGVDADPVVRSAWANRGGIAVAGGWSHDCALTNPCSGPPHLKQGWKRPAEVPRSEPEALSTTGGSCSSRWSS